MSGVEIELRDVDFVTIGTIGPKGKRIFYLQAGHDNRVISLVIEKEQSWALSEAIKELIDDLDTRYEDEDAPEVNLRDIDMDLREPIKPVFRVSQMGLGYDEDQNKIVLVAQELVSTGEEEEEEPGVVRLWCSREQMQALSMQALQTVESGRADPKQNGRLIYYWT